MRALQVWGPVLSVVLALPAQAQQARPDWAWRQRPAPLAVEPRIQGSMAQGGNAVASLVLPGAGQHRLGQTRKWAYLAVEATAWALFFERRHRVGDLRDRYRDLAWTAARIQGPTRVDGDFEYYETLSQWLRSGTFDQDPARGGVQPEPDPTAFNGSIWERARAIFFPAGQQVVEGDPAYSSALGFYEANAYGSAFLWDWSTNPGAQGELRDLIRGSDDRFRQATAALGAVLFNHVVSAVDAYVSGRPSAGREPRVQMVPVGSGHEIVVVVRVPTPR